MNPAKILKLKKCKVCRDPFVPKRSFQTWCSPDCAHVIASAKLAKVKKVKAAVERKADKAKKEKLKSRSEWAAEAQAMVNKYVRLRDAHLGCASCDKPASWDGQWHASHFRSVGAAPGLRYHLWNIHKACSVCNNHLSGNLAGYTPRLIAKIGADRVVWLQSQNAVVRHGVDYFERVKKVFSKKVRRLEKKAGHNASLRAQ